MGSLIDSGGVQERVLIRFRKHGIRKRSNELGRNVKKRLPFNLGNTGSGDEAVSSSIDSEYKKKNNLGTAGRILSLISPAR